MKPSAIICTLLLLCACDRQKPTVSEQPGSKSVQATSPPVEGAHPDGRDHDPRLVLTAAEFHSELATKFLSPVAPRVDPADWGRIDSDAPTQLHFTRVVGGLDGYCGALSAGPIECWGKDKRTFDGRFTDLTLGAHGYCGVDLGGQVTCEKLTPPEGRYVAVVASQGNYCALGASGQVRCFGPDASRPLENLRAEFVVTGADFACAADPTRRLVCWGPEAPLLPIEPVVVKDLAAGDTFVCALREDGRAECFGKGPRLPERDYTSIHAAFGTICGVTKSGSGLCEGNVKAHVSGSVRSFAVAQASACALHLDGTLACSGDDSFGQLDVPRKGKAEESSPEGGERAASARVDAELWLRFIELFPSEPLPLTFDERAKVSLGDRIAPEFEPILGQDPNRFRSGIGVELGHGVLGLTLFDLKERSLHLFLFHERRLIDHLEILGQDEPVSAKQGPGNATAAAVTEARGVTTLITSPTTIERSDFQGHQTKRKAPGSGDKELPPETVECTIDKSSKILRLRSGPQLEWREGGTKRSYEAKEEGCPNRFPF